MKKYLSWIWLVASLGATALSANAAPFIFHWLEQSAEHELITVFFIIAVLFILSFLVFYISAGTPLPSFVVAIFFGVAAHNFLNPILKHEAIMGVLVGLGATLILFGGGLETPFENFKKLFWKIASLSFPGLLLTALLFSFTIVFLNSWSGGSTSLIVAVLLGAVLASTDPAAIIPVLKRLRFKNRSTKDIIISESAVTDVTGTLLTVAFASLIGAGALFATVPLWYKSIFSVTTGLFLAKQLAFGVLFGVCGYWFLELLQRFKKNHREESEVDSAFFLFVPIIIFTAALGLGGSGYLAAFIAGLLFHLTEHLQDTERFFNHIIDGFFKPTIFILLGAIVNIQELFSYAGIGIAAAIIFMCIIRPLTVFLFLGPFSLFGANRLGWRELFFISFVRETGAIPAVLLITLAALKIPGTEGLVPIGMWVILLTLLIQPALTPWVAKKLAVAEPITDEAGPELHTINEQVVILATRGYSFLERLEKVVDWASAHGVKELVVLLCLEDKYSRELETEIKNSAVPVFARLNEHLAAANKPPMTFSFLSRRGFLQENLSKLAEENKNISAIFVGRKMLDYRLEEIKRLPVPFYFM